MMIPLLASSLASRVPWRYVEGLRIGLIDDAVKSMHGMDVGVAVAFETNVVIVAMRAMKTRSRDGSCITTGIASINTLQSGRRGWWDAAVPR